jgi:hypothetical protein
LIERHPRYGTHSKVGRIEEDELGGRIDAGAYDLVAKDIIPDSQRPGRACELAAYVVLGLDSRADVLLRACGNRARNDPKREKADTPTSQ